jgi:DNA-directed RNA polymerase specialized sigma24 family protein
MATSLSKMAVDELLAENEKVMAERAAAEAPLKARSQAINVELNKRAASARLEAALEGLGPDERAELLAAVKGA